MPAEWEPHTATWMGFPPTVYRGVAHSLDEVQDAWAAVANCVAEHEPVHMLCPPDQRTRAARKLTAAVNIHALALDDAWLRDSGPTFVIGDHGVLVGIDWRFNGWGTQTTLDWSADADVGRRVCELAGVPCESLDLVNEGGGIHVNGSDTVLLTETVQRDPERNPGLSRDDVETVIHSALGTERAIWLPYGLWRDYADHGTRGHVDMVACFTPDGEVLLHHQPDTAHPDFERTAALYALLDDAGLRVRKLTAPTTLRDNRDWVDYSYLNHYVCNGAVIFPTFNDVRDCLAQELLADCYPGRAVRGVDARIIFAMGGGVHCITQQQPAL